MRIGVVFPQTELGGDVGAVRAYGEAVDELGFAHILAYDHVVGADPTVHAPWTGPYDVHTTFHEPFVMFGYLAAVTSLELVTGIIILPQRQTVLVAKQAAEVDLLTEGRFRLGVGVGWNAVEYEALGKDFSDRGRRYDEQVEVMRRLWTEEAVTHDGPYERITAAGLAPLPVQRPIPVWFGGQSARRLPPHRPPGRRLVPAGPARAGSGRGAGDHRRGRHRGRPRHLGAGHGGPHRLGSRRRRRPGQARRQVARAGPPTSPSTPWEPVSPPWTITWRRWPRRPGRSV